MLDYTKKLDSPLCEFSSQTGGEGWAAWGL